jgi:hypothetical protein
LLDEALAERRAAEVNAFINIDGWTEAAVYTLAIGHSKPD